MKRKVFATVIALVIVFSTTVISYASANGEVSLYDTNDITFITTRTTRTSATVTVNVGFTQTVDSYSVVIYLQKKVNGEWVLDTTNDDYIFYNNGFNDNDFTFYHKYNSLISGVTYRIKCVSKDYIGNNTFTTVSYSNSF